jgi:hypothetical protein
LANAVSLKSRPLNESSRLVRKGSGEIEDLPLQWLGQISDFLFDQFSRAHSLFIADSGASVNRTNRQVTAHFWFWWGERPREPNLENRTSTARQ